MMKYTLKMTFLAFALIIASCKPSPQKAEIYYDDIISPLEDIFEKEDVLIVLVNSEMDKLANDSSTYLSDTNKAFTDTVFKEIDMAYSNLQIQIAISKNKLELLKGFDKSDVLKVAALDLIDAYSEVCKNEYPELLQIVKIPAEKYSIENDDKFLELSEIIDNKLQEKINVLTREIKLFAEKYNFKIQNDTIKNNDVQNN